MMKSFFGQNGRAYPTAAVLQIRYFYLYCPLNVKQVDFRTCDGEWLFVWKGSLLVVCFLSLPAIGRTSLKLH